MLHRGAAHSFPIARNVPTACVWEGDAGQGALPASVVRALHMTTATEHNLPHVHQHKAEAGGIIPPSFKTIMTVYARAADPQPEIVTRLASDDGGFATAIGKTDPGGRFSKRRQTRLTLLGETGEGPCHGRIPSSGLPTDSDFGEPPERRLKAGSGDSTLIFVLGPTTARSIGTTAMSTADLRTFGQDASAGHVGPNRVCLFDGFTPKENSKKILS